MPNPLQARTEPPAQAAQKADVLPASGQATTAEAHADILCAMPEPCCSRAPE